MFAAYDTELVAMATSLKKLKRGSGRSFSPNRLSGSKQIAKICLVDPEIIWLQLKKEINASKIYSPVGTQGLNYSVNFYVTITVIPQMRMCCTNDCNVLEIHRTQV